MQRAHRRRIAEAQARERPRVGVASVAVDLVGGHHGLDAHPPQQRRDPAVLVRGADGDVDDEDGDVGSAQCPLGLRAHLGIEVLAPG